MVDHAARARAPGAADGPGPRMPGVRAGRAAHRPRRLRRGARVMTRPPTGTRSRTSVSASELAQLHAQVDAARDELSRLRREVTISRDSGGGRVADLVEANEQLVLATVQAQAQVAATTHALDEAARTAGLDALTELPNRILMLDRVRHAIATPSDTARASRCSLSTWTTSSRSTTRTDTPSATGVAADGSGAGRIGASRRYRQSPRR